MSEELVKTLNRRIEELTAEVAGFKAEAKDRRLKGSGLKADLEKLRKDHEVLLADRDTWKGKAEASEPELRAELDRIKGEVRSGKHRAAFDTAAKQAGLDPESPEGKQAVADLWQLSGYQAEADEPDPAAIAGVFDQAKAARSYLFRPTEPEQIAPGETPPTRLTVPQGSGQGRGGSDLGAIQYRVRSGDLADPAFMEKNGARIADAHRDGTLKFVD